MTIYFTPDGRFSTNGVFANDGTLVKPGTMFLVDGTRLFELHDHTVPVYAFTSSLQSKAITGTYISYDIGLSCTNMVDPGYSLNASVPIPAGFTLVNAVSNEGTYNATTGKWTLLLNTSQEATLNLILSPTGTGTKTQTVSLDGGTATLTSTCVISASDSEGAIASHSVDLADYPDTLANMQDGKQYTIVTYSRVHETGVTGIHDGVKNNRISVTNNITSYGTRATIQDSIQKITCTFIYDSNHSVVITWNDEYQSVSTNTEDREYGLCINEGYNPIYSESTNLLTDPTALLDDTSSSNLTLPGASESAEYIYTISTVTEPTGNNPFFTGIKASLNSFSNSNSGLEAYITNEDDTESDIKTTYINKTGEISLGDLADLWGITDSDITTHTLSIHLIFTNSSLTTQTLSYNNLSIALYYNDDQTQGAEGFILDGTHSRNYHLLLLEVTIPEGPEREFNTVSLPLSDGEVIVSQSLKAQSIDITFVVWGDTLEEAKTKLTSISKWFTNERNQLGIPVTLPLVFDFDTTRTYNVVLHDPIDPDISYTSIKCKATFDIPKGAAISTTLKTTGPIGVNEGVTSVRPIINVISDGSASLIITDNVSGQTFTLNGVSPNTNITIDCSDRTIVDDAGTSYITSVDISSVWFNFFSSYELSCTGGVIQSVEYYENY